MSQPFEGRWRWAIAIAGLVGFVVGQLLPDGWNALEQAVVVGAVTALCMLAAAAVRARIGE